MEIKDWQQALNVISESNPVSITKPRLCELSDCANKAIGKYYVEPDEDCISGWVKVCSDCAKQVERFGYEVRVYKYIKKNEKDNLIETDCSHNWVKHSLVTQEGGFDWMKCSECGLFGKRYGLGLSGVTELCWDIRE